MTSKEQLTIEQLEYYRNTYERYDGIESNIFERICNELIDFKKSKTYILDECIKEWEEKGWEWHMDKICIKLINKEDRDIDIHMWLSDKTYTKAYKEFYQYITLEEHNLIHKTIKAVEVNE